MRFLAIIPARGGSKGVPRKNLAPLGGRPLLVWTVETARDCAALARVVVSTEDEEIAGVARAHGVEVIARPPALAADDTPTLPVVQHAVRTLEAAGAHFDAVVLLQPTCPFRTGADIARACALFEARRPDALLSVLPVPDPYHPCWVYFEDADGYLRGATGAPPPPRRQELPRAFHRDGSLYITARDVLMVRGSLYGDRLLPMPTDPAHTVNIDLPTDLDRARRLVEGG